MKLKEARENTAYVNIKDMPEEAAKTLKAMLLEEIMKTSRDPNYKSNLIKLYDADTGQEISLLDNMEDWMNSRGAL